VTKMRNLAKPEQRRREQVLLVTVAVDAERFVSDSSRVMAVLKKAGYVARPTNHETLRLVAENPEELPQFREIGPPFDPPPETAA
jgi:hypothetical protein